MCVDHFSHAKAHNSLFFVLIFSVYFVSIQTQRVIKDERFSIGIEPEDDSLWLPAQLLRTTSSVLVQGSSATEETLVNILRLFLSMACSPSCTLNGRLLIEILSKCGNDNHDKCRKKTYKSLDDIHI